MSYGNRKGPQGIGPKTGRGQGLCNEFEAPGFMNRSQNRGRGRRSQFEGSGRGRRGGGGRRRQGESRRFQENDQINVSEEEHLENLIVSLDEERQIISKRLEKIKENSKEASG